jgi:hypothetical protein
VFAMSRFSLDELQRKDFVSALTLWVVAEFVGLLLFPALGVINPGAKLKTWFALSIPLGIGGALLIPLCSRFVAITNDRQASRNSKQLGSILGQLGGWLGLAGVVYPLVVASIEFFSTLKFGK